MATYTNTRASKVSVGKIDFLPGETRNDISDDLAKILEAKDSGGKLKHPLRKGRTPKLQPGQVALPAAAPTAALKSLEGLDLIKALAQVRLSTDLDTLAAWHATDQRKEVQDAITARAKELNKG